jgi:transposase
MDLGDKTSEVFILDATGDRGKRAQVKMDRKSLTEFFGEQEPLVVALEVGTHSPWVSRLLMKQGHEVVVANPRNLPMITRSNKKNDRTDAEMLARLVRVDRKLLSPVEHRSAEEAGELLTVKARALLVRSRTQQVNFVRQTVKSAGVRIAACSTEVFPERVRKLELDAEMMETLRPVLASIEFLTAQIRLEDRRIGEVVKRHPETETMRTIPGVGPVTALAFRLVLQTPTRFPDSRTVGSYLGLRPRQDQSGDTDKQMRITKAGDTYLRTLLVGSAQYILGRFGPDSDLREWGLKLAERGGKNAKKRAVVAVARKLAVLMLVLWKTGRSYEPRRGTNAEIAA